MAQDSIYTQAVEISEEYLGPAGERFLRRQIDTHLGIVPESLKKNHLPKLTKWTELAFALLTNDYHEVSSYTSNLLSLGVSKPVSDEKTR
ncbi:MAG: hypothetical protein JWO47_313 [Candidatus Saccharibacteria bacterium]|nr:hypothetical protein [Candidatus Saccharibacteria bacterium]